MFTAFTNCQQQLSIGHYFINKIANAYTIHHCQLLISTFLEFSVNISITILFFNLIIIKKYS